MQKKKGRKKKRQLIQSTSKQAVARVQNGLHTRTAAAHAGNLLANEGNKI